MPIMHADGVAASNTRWPEITTASCVVRPNHFKSTDFPKQRDGCIMMKPHFQGRPARANPNPSIFEKSLILYTCIVIKVMAGN